MTIWIFPWVLWRHIWINMYTYHNQASSYEKRGHHWQIINFTCILHKKITEMWLMQWPRWNGGGEFNHFICSNVEYGFYSVYFHSSTSDCCPCLLTVNSYSASHDNWCTATLWNRVMTAQCEGMGEAGSARYEPALLPPCPSIRVLSYSNCQEIHSRQQTGLAV